jgi:hypothetical protein
MTLALITLLSALSISSIAALYSLLGLAAIFSAAKIPVLLMGGVLEVGKLVTASWLYQNWKRTPILLKSYLSFAVIVLVFITSMGIFGFLSKAHLDQTISVGDNSLEIAQIETRIEREQKRIKDADLVISQLDKAVQVLIDYDRVRGDTGAIATREKQKEERAELNAIIDDASDRIATLNQEKLVLSKEQIELEAEVGPLKYIAELIYGDEAKDHFDEAVRWVILLLIFVFDPLAVLLLIAANQSLRDARLVKVKNEDIADFTEVDAHAIDKIPGTSDAEETEKSDTQTEETSDISETVEKPDETEQVKEIITEDERKLWKKFQARKEWKVKDSGITHHEYVEEERRQNK